jgi:hypothetical protein
MKNRIILPKLSFIAMASFCLIAMIFVQGCSRGTSKEQAADILKKSGVKGGLIVHLNCGDGILTESLMANDSYLVQGLDPEIENVRRAREYIASKREYGPISVDRLTEARLPYRDNMVDLIVAEDLGEISAEYRLDSLPVWDGMIAANGNIYLASMNGEATCYSEKGN